MCFPVYQKVNECIKKSLLRIVRLPSRNLVTRGIKCFFFFLQGDFSDYELLKHQLADPEIDQGIHTAYLRGAFRRWAHTCNVLLTGCPDFELAAGVSELCDSAQ